MRYRFARREPDDAHIEKAPDDGAEDEDDDNKETTVDHFSSSVLKFSLHSR
jgi:hypothetical protein